MRFLSNIPNCFGFMKEIFFDFGRITLLNKLDVLNLKGICCVRFKAFFIKHKALFIKILLEKC